MSALNISSFIWGIADDVLRDVYVRGKYRDVILPMTVIRRLDAVLEPTKDAVLRMKEQLDAAGITNQDAALRQTSGEAFYNTSAFRLRDLASRSRQQQLRADFEAYLDGFSPNVQEVLEKFRFRNQIPTLVEADVLAFLLEKFLDGSVAETRDVPVIFLSAYGQDKLVARAFDLGAADYVVKPFSPTELSARIRAESSVGEKPRRLRGPMSWAI